MSPFFVSSDLQRWMLPTALTHENSSSRPPTCAEPQATLPMLGTKPFITSELMPVPPAHGSKKCVHCLTEYMIEEIRMWENPRHPSAALLGEAECFAVL